jgi:carotenoid cleavage dioxygenase-like enzyme
VTDNASVTFYESALPGEGVALTEATNGTLRIRLSDLATIGAIKPNRKAGIKGGIQTAHPQKLSDGRLLNVFQNVPYGSLQVVTNVFGDGGAPPEVLYDLKVSNNEGLHPWMHDLAVTDNYIALVEQPVFFDIKVRTVPSCDVTILRTVGHQVSYFSEFLSAS